MRFWDFTERKNNRNNRNKVKEDLNLTLMVVKTSLNVHKARNIT